MKLFVFCIVFCFRTNGYNLGQVLFRFSFVCNEYIVKEYRLKNIWNLEGFFLFEDSTKEKKRKREEKKENH